MILIYLILKIHSRNLLRFQITLMKILQFHFQMEKFNFLLLQITNFNSKPHQKKQDFQIQSI